MDEHEGETDGQAAELAVGMAAVGDAEDDHKEHEGQQAFNEECTAGGNGEVARVGTAASLLEGFAKAIGCENASGAELGGIPNAEQQSTSDDTADELGSPVAQHFLETHAAVDENAKTDSRIKVSARDVADAISHGHHGQTEGDGNAKETDMSEEGGTATSKDEDECAEQFGEEFVTNLHSLLILN